LNAEPPLIGHSPNLLYKAARLSSPKYSPEPNQIIGFETLLFSVKPRSFDGPVGATLILIHEIAKGKIFLLFIMIWFIIFTGKMSIGRKKKALVHIAKGDLNLDEESYRQILKGVAGVESSTQLTVQGFEKVMKRFQEMGFKGLLPDPYQPVPKGRLIPSGSPEGLASITLSQQNFINYLLEKLNWDEDHNRAFCQRIIKRSDPVTKRDGQKIIIGLMAILRKREIQKMGEKRRN
jgi:hypothetical protein